MIFIAQPLIFKQQSQFSSNFFLTSSTFAHVCLSLLGLPTLDPPPSSSSPLSWASYHQSPGVLCAQPEWLGWALAFITVLGATAHVLLQHCHQMCTLSPAEQARTYFHPLSSP